MAETKTGKAKAKAKKSQAKKSSSAASKSSSAASKASGEAAKNGVAPLLQKAKLPLLAGGAAVAGVAGTVLATRSGRRHKKKVLGVSMPKSPKLSLPKGNGLKADARKAAGAVAGAAKRADSFGQGVSRIASSVQKVGESAEEAVKKG